MIGLWRAEQDDDIRVRLARGLALYGTEKAVAVAREVVAESRGDAERGEILDILCAQEVARGVDNDETRRHLRAMESGARERRAGLARFERLKSGLSLTAGKSGSGPRQEKPVKPLVPARPAAPKPPVGRNEPCPCGSGKKFKKCCG